MPNLTHQAETAVLGALLNDPRLLGGLPYLTAGDFADARHQALYTAITRTRVTHPDAAIPRLYVLVARAAGHPGITPLWLGRLAEAIPEPAHAASYGRMVQEASLRRALAGHADRLARDTAALVAVRGAGQDPDPAASHLARLATALRSHAQSFDPPLIAGGDRAGAPARDGPSGPRAQREEQVLAGLLQHLRQASQIIRWLPTEAFTPGLRRETYQAIRDLASRGEPVSELTVAWEMSSRQALDQAAQASGTGPAGPQDNRPYLARLASIVTGPAAAITTGRWLLADHLLSQVTAGQAGHSSQPAGPASGARPGAAGHPGPRPRSGRAAETPQLRPPPPGPGITVNGYQPRP